MKRRTLLSVIGMLPVHLALAEASPEFVSRTSFNPADPIENLHAMARLNGGVAGQPAIWWLKGRVYGMPVGELRVALCGIIGCRSVAYEPDGNGYQITTRDWGIFTTLDGEAPLEELVNPFTKERVRPRSILTTPYQWKIDPIEGQILKATEQDTQSSLVGRPFTMPWHFQGNRLWSQLESFVKYPTGAVGSEILALTANSSDVFSSSNKFVPATVTWVNEAPWLPWLNMKGVPGGGLMVSSGQKERGVDELPQFVVDITEKTFPGLLKKPADWKRPA